MNLHSAIIINGGEQQKLRLSDQLEIPIPEKADTQLKEGQKVIMGIRIEDLFIAHADDKTSAELTYMVDGTVKIVEPLGNETNLHMDIQGANLVARSEGRRIFSSGEQLKMTLDLTHLHIFDAESELSIY
jgi:multiple sugar transport system ATP-binding protein